jgi:hypothetical protein
MKSKYYIRVAMEHASDLYEHFNRNGVVCEQLSVDIDSKNVTTLFAVRMESEDALNMKLSFPIVGIMDFNKVLGKQLDKSVTIN